VDGKDGFLYGIPCHPGGGARRAAKFNLVDKSTELIGPDLEDYAWMCGILLAKNGSIYCPPCAELLHKMLKINTCDGTVVTLAQK
jgi:hypothetical protein